MENIEEIRRREWAKISERERRNSGRLFWFLCAMDILILCILIRASPSDQIIGGIGILATVPAIILIHRRLSHDHQP